MSASTTVTSPSVGAHPVPSRDRRSGGVWTRRQTVKNFLIAVSVRLAFRIADRTPQALLLSLGRALGRAFRIVSPRALDQAVQHASCCLPGDAATQIGYRSFERAGENLATSVLLRRASVRALDWVEIPKDALECLVSALGVGRGTVFISAHLGPFELLPAAVSELGLRPAIVVRESYDPRLDAWIDEHRRSRGIDVIHRGAPGAPTRIIRALRASQPVGFLPDLGGRVPQIEVTFLGRRVGFPLGPQQIAQRVGAPIVVGTLHRRAGRSASMPLFVLRARRVEITGNLAEITQRVATALEEGILVAAEDFPWVAAPLSPALPGTL